jgi:hypothetical protein
LSVFEQILLKNNFNAFLIQHLTPVTLRHKKLIHTSFIAVLGRVRCD